MNYTVEEVRNAARLLDGLSRRMLTDYAERIEADESAVPDGYVLVPREPTDEMADAGSSEWRNENIFRIWDAMLAAAPSPGESA